MVTNEVLNTILSRKGVKQYKSNPVPRELLEAIVAAGIAAPNAFNRQAWHFSVITNKTLLEEIDAETNHRLGDEEGYHSLYGAPVLIVISSARDNNFAKQDCSAANENMALAAKSLGLASRYLDVPNLYTNTPEGAGCKEMCGIPKDYDTVCFLCLGYSDDISEQPTPKRGDVVNYVDEGKEDQDHAEDCYQRDQRGGGTHGCPPADPCRGRGAGVPRGVDFF